MPIDRKREETERALRALAPQLDRLTAPEPSDALVHQTLLRTSALLSERARIAEGARPKPADARGTLPVGFKRELGRLVAATLLPIALVLGWNFLVLSQGPALLEAWLPGPLPIVLPAAYALGSLGWLALTWASLPFAAHRMALLRTADAA